MDCLPMQRGLKDGYRVQMFVYILFKFSFGYCTLLPASWNFLTILEDYQCWQSINLVFLNQLWVRIMINFNNHQFFLILLRISLKEKLQKNIMHKGRMQMCSLSCSVSQKWHLLIDVT